MGATVHAALLDFNEHIVFIPLRGCQHALPSIPHEVSWPVVHGRLTLGPYTTVIVRFSLCSRGWVADPPATDVLGCCPDMGLYSREV
jgi:hypothetical protein